VYRALIFVHKKL